VRGTVRHLERLEKMNYHAPGPESSVSESSEDEYPGSPRGPSYRPESATGPHPPDPEERPAAQEASEGRRGPWWRRWFGG
jgi:hypothetical protein